MSDTTYTPPEVWTWKPGNGGQFANINRPVSGATHDKVLRKGEHPLQLYSLATPNGVKVTILLEELLAAGEKGAEYDAWLTNILEGDQFGSGFVEVNPNSKIPALIDESGETPVRVFESGSILRYLAEKFGRFIPEAHAKISPLLAGGLGLLVGIGGTLAYQNYRDRNRYSDDGYLYSNNDYRR